VSNSGYRPTVRLATIVAAMLLVMSFAGPPQALSAQAIEPRVGQSVRITAPELLNRRRVGVVRQLGDSELIVQLSGREDLLTVPHPRLQCLESSTGPDPYAGRFVGAVVGSLGWMTAMWLSDLRYDGTTGANMGYVWTPVFAVIGWKVGGHFQVGQAWVPMRKPRLAFMWDCGGQSGRSP